MILLKNWCRIYAVPRSLDTGACGHRIVSLMQTHSTRFLEFEGYRCGDAMMHGRPYRMTMYGIKPYVANLWC